MRFSEAKSAGLQARQFGLFIRRKDMELILRVFRPTGFLLICGLSFLIGAFISISPIDAADPVGWEDLGLYGGQINAIAIDPVDPNIMFAGAYYGDGLFKSTNGGDSWQTVNGFRNELVLSIELDPQNHRTIWVATWWYIYRSEDGGTTWSRFDPGDPRNGYYYSVAVDPSDSNIVYIGTAGTYGSDDNARVYKSTDGGATWQETSLRADHNIVDLAINPQNPQEIWAVTGPHWIRRGSIYRSGDGGASWQEINTGLIRGWFQVVAVSPQSPASVYVGGEWGLYYSKDGGTTWSPGDPQYSCRGLALDPQDPNTVYTSWIDSAGGVISKSTDGGNRWIDYAVGTLEFLCLAVDPGDRRVLFGGDANQGFYASTDGGETWQTKNQGIRANHVFDSAISSDGALLAGSLGGVFLKSPAENWQQINPLMPYAVAFSPDGTDTIYAGIGSEFGKSVDAGNTWSYTSFSFSLIPHRIVSIATNPQNPDVLYLGVFYGSGTKGEIYKTVDAGSSLQLLQALNVPVNAVIANPQNPQIVYAGSGSFYAPIAPGAVYKSINEGESWDELGLNDKCVNALAIDPQNPDTIYAACGASNGFYAGLLKSSDGGNTWEDKDFGLPEYAAIVDIAIDHKNANTIYAATILDGVYISYDGGKYWTRLGLSDYHLLHILASTATPAGLEISGTKRAVLEDQTELYVGSGSGMLEFNGSGIGMITGMVTGCDNEFGIDGSNAFH